MNNTGSLKHSALLLLRGKSSKVDKTTDSYISGKYEWTGAPASPSFTHTMCHWELFKRSCQQVVQLSAHPCWSVGAPLTERKERHREGSSKEKEKCFGSFYLSVGLTALQGMPGEEDQCRTSRFPQFIVPGSQIIFLRKPGAQSFPLW